ncbi:MAG: hypothetical protein K0U98_13525 [Deltaproteobacteria bacterium]|nr:hypothetical protein [Deltaproteobacteria bacterium]
MNRRSIQYLFLLTLMTIPAALITAQDVVISVTDSQFHPVDSVCIDADRSGRGREPWFWKEPIECDDAEGTPTSECDFWFSLNRSDDPNMYPELGSCTRIPAEAYTCNLLPEPLGPRPPEWNDWVWDPALRSDCIPANWAVWRPTGSKKLPEPGCYAVLAEIPPAQGRFGTLGDGITADAGYVIFHEGRAEVVRADHRTPNPEHLLGVYGFNNKGQEYIYLDDITEDSGFRPAIEKAIAIGDIIFRPSACVPPTETETVFEHTWGGEKGGQAFGDLVGDPVTPTTGNFTLREEDIGIPGLGESELAIRRFYNAQKLNTGLFGKGWTTVADVRLQIYSDRSAMIWFEDGQGRYFKWNDSAFSGANGIFDQLEEITGGWRLTTPDQWVYEFEAHGLADAFGRITQKIDRYGNATTFAYDADDQLLSVTDASGRSLNFTHSDERITSMSDPLGRRWLYSYSDDKLSAVTDPRGGIARYGYGDSQCMTSVSDPEGIVYLRNVYEVVDDRCRVVEQYDAAGTVSTFSYSPGETAFTDNLGRTTTFVFDQAFRRTERIDALGESERFVWNDEYQLQEYTDRRGNSWSYDYDDQDNLVHSICPTGCTTSSVYNGENDPEQVTNAVGNTTSFTWVNGSPEEILQADGGTTSMTYDGFGQVTSRTDPNGKATTFQYDGFGSLIEIRDPLGQVTSMTYDLAGRQLSMTDGNGRTTRFAFDAGNNVVAVIDPKTQITTYEYALNDRLVRLTDRRGGVRSFEYDVNLRLVAEVDPEQHRTEHAYDLMYNRISTRDARGNTTQFRYDDLDRLVEIKDALAQINRFEYDENGNLLRQIDPLGAVTEHSYEERNLRESTTDALSGLTQREFDALGRLTATVNPRSARTEYEYDPMNRLAVVRDALGGETEHAYDPAGNLIVRTDGNGHSTVLTYDSIDRLTSIRDPEGHQANLAYDAVRNLTQVTNGRGAITYFAYDPNDNLVRLQDALSGIALLTYDAEDNRTHITDPNGNTTRLDYDLDGLLVGLGEAGGQESTLGYDSGHNLRAFTNAKGHTTHRSYDPLNRLTSEIDPLGHETQFAYDPLNRLLALTDAEGNTTGYGYDLLGRLIAVTDALSQVTEYSYDPMGNLTLIRDANAQPTSFEYDLLDRVTQEINAVGSTWRYGYDAVGNLVEKRNARGQRIAHTYNRDDLLVRSRFPDKPDVRFSYDDAHNLTRIVDALGATQQVFDLLDRLTSSTNHVGQEVAYTFDAAGNRTSFRHQDDSLMRYEYDANNRQSRIVDPNGNIFDASYDLTHNLERIDYPNSTAATLAYDTADRLLSLTNRQVGGELISQFAYTLDRVGNRIRTEEAYRWPHLRSVVTDYQYDPTHRLVRSSDDLGRFNEYQFDAVGNRLGLHSNYDPYRTPTDVAPYTVTSSYDNADRLIHGVHSVFGATAYTYDEDGNRVRRQGPNVWTGADDTLRTDSKYDSENRLTRIASQRQVNRRRWQKLDETTMEYDGFDRLFRRTRDKKQGGGGRKWSDFVYDGLDPVSEHAHPSPQYTNYHRGLGRMLSLREKRGGGQGNLYYYHHDGLGSVSALTKHSGQSVHAYRYSDYGIPLDNNGRAADSSNFTNPHNHFTYTGQEWVEETWNMHFHSREYDPVAGVWSRADDFRGGLVEPATLHRFSYVGDNPTRFRDRYGYSREPSVTRSGPVLPKYLTDDLSSANIPSAAALVADGSAGLGFAFRKDLLRYSEEFWHSNLMTRARSRGDSSLWSFHVESRIGRSAWKTVRVAGDLAGTASDVIDIGRNVHAGSERLAEAFSNENTVLGKLEAIPAEVSAVSINTLWDMTSAVPVGALKLWTGTKELLGGDTSFERILIDEAERYEVTGDGIRENIDSALSTATEWWTAPGTREPNQIPNPLLSTL